VANKVKGWGQPLFGETGKPLTAIWHGFTYSGHAVPRPTSLCGQVYDAVGPLRDQGSIPGEVCYYCRLVADKA
jgi:hypothetical protein